WGSDVLSQDLTPFSYERCDPLLWQEKTRNSRYSRSSVQHALPQCPKPFRQRALKHLTHVVRLSEIRKGQIFSAFVTVPPGLFLVRHPDRIYCGLAKFQPLARRIRSFLKQ